MTTHREHEYHTHQSCGPVANSGSVQENSSSLMRLWVVSSYSSQWVQCTLLDESVFIQLVCAFWNKLGYSYLRHQHFTADLRIHCILAGAAQRTGCGRGRGRDVSFLDLSLINQSISGLRDLDAGMRDSTSPAGMSRANSSQWFLCLSWGREFYRSAATNLRRPRSGSTGVNMNFDPSLHAQVPLYPYWCASKPFFHWAPSVSDSEKNKALLPSHCLFSKHTSVRNPF